MKTLWKLIVPVGIVLSIAVLVVAAFIPVADEPVEVQVVYDEPWCEAMMLKPGKEWGEEETVAFSEHCLQ
ncbi:DUF3012 domain-containing protein [Halioxenophilus sp. WMMB6]|uniref:DUF3012 domain-containing protein n=1 Tax=Halioxenophilus sp. WMMB6 TaxID=3073815 RepID=UPI00295F0DC1|nr:DUF3012 domain-containing protein [Halioxenophilus sp. WMMB6]